MSVFILLLICFLIGFPIYYYRNKYVDIKRKYGVLAKMINVESNGGNSVIEKENSELKRQLSELKYKYDNLYNSYKNTISNKQSTNKQNNIRPYGYADIKYSVQEINNIKDDFIGWINNGTKFSLIIKKRIVGEVDYEPRCNYVNKGWNEPEIIQANAQCCTINIGGAYIQMRAPQKGIVYYVENKNLKEGDIVLTIESDLNKIDEFEKKSIKDKLLEKKRKQELEKAAMQELMDEGELFPEAGKRPPIPKDVVDAVWRRDGGKCVYCGSTENLQLDHIIPFSKGGATTVENLQLLCQKCNLQKSNKIG